MTLGDLKLEVLKLLDEDEGLTAESINQSEYDNKNARCNKPSVKTLV